MADRDTTDTGRTGPQDTVAGMKQTLGRKTGEAADAAMDAGRETVGAAQGRIRSLLEHQTDRAADQLGGVASALHKAADQLNAENNGTAAQYAVQAADRVERVADMLRHSSLDDIIGEVEGFARRQPEVFIGGAFALGFLAARFIKSSGERRLHGRVDTAGTAHNRAVAAADRHARRTSDYRTSEGASRAMAGGIAESALRTPRRTGEGSEPGSGFGGPAAGTPRPTAGMPLSRAPASMTGHAPPPAGPAAAPSLGSGMGGSGMSGNTGSSSTIKPQGQQP